MDTIKLSLQKEDIDQLATVEQSIVHWSVELARGLLQIESLEETIATLYESKTDLPNGVSARYDVPQQRIRQYKINYQTGELYVALEPEGNAPQSPQVPVGPVGPGAPVGPGGPKVF